MDSKRSGEIVHIQYDSPEWVEFRKDKIGGSDAASVLGLSPWRSNDVLWYEKKNGIVRAESNDAIRYGKLAEEPIAKLFELDHESEYEVNIPKDVVWVKHGCLMASLDGLLTERSTRRVGILEVKTAQSMHLWGEKIPDYYYCQVLHYMNVVGAEFAVLIVYFRQQKLFKEYMFEREDHEVSMTVLEQRELAFVESLKNDNPPARILPGVKKEDIYGAIRNHR